jgi:hypothetical protein
MPESVLIPTPVKATRCSLLAIQEASVSTWCRGFDACGMDSYTAGRAIAWASESQRTEAESTQLKTISPTLAVFTFDALNLFRILDSCCFG